VNPHGKVIIGNFTEMEVAMITHPKILYLFSGPLVALDGSPLDVLDLKTERDAIVREISACEKTCSLRIGYATTEELARGIEDGFNILTVSTHGREEFLLFEDGKGGSQPVTGEYLKRLISTGGGIELIIISACHSEEIGAMLAETGVPHVVAVRRDFPVVDQSAIVFTAHFFRSLFLGNSVQKAFEMASLLVEGNPELMKMRHHLEVTAYGRREKFTPEEKKFILLPRGAAHQNPLFSPEVPQGAVALEEPLVLPSNLPTRLQFFAGRLQEMHAVINELFHSRVVTLTGVGGMGKTTVALEVARWFCSRNFFPHGIHYIDLRQTDTADGALDLMCAALGVQVSRLQNVITYLEDRRCLLVLDNAEDVLWHNENELQNILDTILRSTAHTKLLITSQRPVGGNLYEPERVVRISSLEQKYATLLFCATTKRGISPDEYGSPLFFDLLDQLGGHPLSIVLTARQVAPGVTLEDICERIEIYKAKAIKIKHITDRILDHGESLVTALTSTYHTLSDRAQILFQVLSLLPAGARQGILEEIWGNPVWDIVQELNDASLVEVRKKRVTLLPPVRLFALTVLIEEVKKCYSQKIAEVMGTYTKMLYKNHTTEDSREYRVLFTVEEPNLRAVLDLPSESFERGENISSLGLFGAELTYLYIFHNRWKEADTVGSRILSHLKRLEDLQGEAHVLIALGVLAFRTGNLEEAKTRYERALQIYQDIHARMGVANAFWTLGDLFFRTGDPKEAQNRFEEALSIYQEIDVDLGKANSLLRLGLLAFLTGNSIEAQERLEKALKIYRDIHVEIGEANTLRILGDFAMWRGDLDSARIQYQKALRIYEHNSVKDGEARALVHLARWAALADKREHMQTYLDDAFAIYKEIEDLDGQAHAHMVKALLFLKNHDLVKARRQLEFCSSIQEKTCQHSEAAQWLITYAGYFMLDNYREEALLCLEYAEESALTARNLYLLERIREEQELL
jgi:tetratricopeptide (TPR) repeat protein